MKQKLLTTITTMLFTAFTFAQAPQGMNYQATVRDNNGNAITNHAVGFKFNIRQGSGSGTIVYAETQTPTSDQFGGVSLVIGQGTVVSGNFSNINWASGTYFNEVLIDPTGGTNYVSMGASQLMSVPYALYAKNASGSSYNVKFNGVSITDSTINDITTGGWGGYFGFLTENNYWYMLVRGTNTSNNISNTLFTTDTISNNVVYIINDFSSFNDAMQGYITYMKSNIVNGFYYIPLNSTEATVSNLFRFEKSTNHYSVVDNGTPQQVYQLTPNNSSVTGFNLTLPVKVTIER